MSCIFYQIASRLSPAGATAYTHNRLSSAITNDSNSNMRNLSSSIRLHDLEFSGVLVRGSRLVMDCRDTSDGISSSALSPQCAGHVFTTSKKSNARGQDMDAQGFAIGIAVARVSHGMTSSPTVASPLEPSMLPATVVPAASAVHPQRRDFMKENFSSTSDTPPMYAKAIRINAKSRLEVKPSVLPAPVMPATSAVHPQRRNLMEKKLASAPETKPVYVKALRINVKSRMGVKTRSALTMQPLLASTLKSKVASRFTSRKIASRQSGEVGVSWHAEKAAWRATYRLEGKSKQQYFRVSRFQTRNLTWKAADKEALQAAKRARYDALERQGAESCKKLGIPHSGISGVHWVTARRAWGVRVKCTSTNGTQKTKQVFGGYFKPTNDTPAARDEELQNAKKALKKLYQKLGITYVLSSD